MTNEPQRSRYPAVLCVSMKIEFAEHGVLFHNIANISLVLICPLILTLSISNLEYVDGFV